LLFFISFDKYGTCLCLGKGKIPGTQHQPNHSNQP